MRFEEPFLMLRNCIKFSTRLNVQKRAYVTSNLGVRHVEITGPYFPLLFGNLEGIFETDRDRCLSNLVDDNGVVIDPMSKFWCPLISVIGITNPSQLYVFLRFTNL